MVAPAIADDADVKSAENSSNPSTTTMTEVSSTPSSSDTETPGWQSIYSAYSCVYHQSYALATRWLMSALRENAGTPVMKASKDLSYLSMELSSIAAKRHEAAVPESSCDAQILQALMLSIVENKSSAIDKLKMVAINNPTYPSLQSLRAKIRSMEFEMSNAQWQVPPDVLRADGKTSDFTKWKVNKFPLRVYIPPDANAMKISGYRAGDGQLFRAACEAWQSQTGGLVRFVYEPVQTRADITCAWVSDQKELELADAVGICSFSIGKDGFLDGAKVKVLTFVDSFIGAVPSGESAQFRKKYLEQGCMHEIGHSFGLNHSASEKDVMWTQAHWPPITRLTAGDISASKSLYQNNVFDYVRAAIDATLKGQYNAAAVSFDKVSSNSKESQTRTLICIWLTNAAANALDVDKNSAAILLLEKANALAPSNDSAKTKEHVLKALHNAYLHAGKTNEAAEMEKKNAWLRTAKDSAAFLDQYGLKPESLPYYEQALAKSPDDLAIRNKFCFLLVMLAKDETNKNNFDEAISLLIRAKGLFRPGMPNETTGKVLEALRLAYLQENRYDEADQTAKELYTQKFSPATTKVITPEDDIATLVTAAKKIHPKDWSSSAAAKTQSDEVRLTYEQYVEALRSLANSMKAKDEPSWAVSFVVRHRQHDGRGADDPFSKMYTLRHSLVALTDESTVIQLESQLSFKKGL